MKASKSSGARSQAESPVYHLQLQYGVTKYEIKMEDGTILTIEPGNDDCPKVGGTTRNGKDITVRRSKPFKHAGDRKAGTGGSGPAAPAEFHCHVFLFYDPDGLSIDPPVAIVIICHDA